MTDFVHEQVNKLNNALSTLFQNQSVNSSELINTPVDPIHALDHKDYTLFLTCASREIDLSSTTNLPDMEAIQKYLNLYHQHCSASVSVQDNNDSLEWLFVAKCTVAVYGFMLRNILNSTLPLSEAIRYWNSVYGSNRYETYYALQTLPIRVTYLGINTVKKMRTTKLGLKGLFDSPEHLFCNMFPIYAREWIRSSQQKSFRFFSVRHGSMFKQLIHEEIRQKIHTLNYFRTQQASRLGLMMKMTPFMAMFEEGKDILNIVSTQSNQCLYMMKRILEPLTVDKENMGLHSFDVKDTIECVKSSVAEQSKPADIAKGLSEIINDWNKCQENIASLKKVYGPPSFLTRYWISGVIGYFAGNAAIKIITERQDDIVEWFSELGTTARDFVVNWIWEPILQVWDTIRLKDERLSVLGKEGLRSDLDSLERMVSEFARDHYNLPENEVGALIQNVRQGDMSLILKAYENEIKHPLRSAVKGDLIQTLLIQVQKTKVDVDLAMAALDKLLKSNELNFAFLAVAPSMLIAWGGLSWMKRIWQRRSGRNIGMIGLPIRQTMRRIERLFNLTNTKHEKGLLTNNDNNILSLMNDDSVKYQQQQLDCESQGVLLCEVHLLRSYVRYLPTRNSIRDLFIEDLRDLENPRLTISQKLQTIERMGRSWSFLRPC